MRISEHAQFVVTIPLVPESARKFVAHIEYPLAEADFLRDVRITGENPRVVHAEIPVKAGMFGQHTLRFASEVHETDTGAELVPVPDPTARGWAELAGAAVVQPHADGSEVAYNFTFSLEVELPGALRWGEGALTKMVEVTAQSILRGLASDFPRTIEAAARTYAQQLLPDAKIREDRS